MLSLLSLMPMTQTCIPMKILAAVASILAIREVASAGAAPPQVTIGVKGGADGSLEVKPAIKWNTETEIAGANIEGGITSIVEDLGHISYNVWAKVKKSFGVLAVSSRAGVSSDAADIVDLDVRLEGRGAMAQVSATAGNGKVDVNSVQAKTGFAVAGGRVTVNNRYNLKSSKAVVSIGYDMDKMGFGVVASKDNQKLTVSRSFGDSTTVSPSIATDGDFALAVQQKTDIGTVTGTYKLKDFLSLEWVDGPWVANVVAPMNGIDLKGIKFSVKKAIDFE